MWCWTFPSVPWYYNNTNATLLCSRNTYVTQWGGYIVYTNIRGVGSNVDSSMHTDIHTSYKYNDERRSKEEKEGEDVVAWFYFALFYFGACEIASQRTWTVFYPTTSVSLFFLLLLLLLFEFSFWSRTLHTILSFHLFHSLSFSANRKKKQVLSQQREE